MQPSKIRIWLMHVINKYHLKYITVHGLRHTHASLLFEAGATIKEVQDRLGHSDVKTTMDIYTHVSKYARKETASKFSQYINAKQ
ncbi:tyrosine-type recombinase/integrase [Secundilactobacillus silagei]|uniref:tyrosine-type recombinase/integrase n=1 Tax=Secundilactobacillus silagei TaxID=1293415 RepID=UPI0025B1147F|nr:tyrosine-type recombinase/integrase [Secundilactobacillus silagei]